jgi:hypothetical protein
MKNEGLVATAAFVVIGLLTMPSLASDVRARDCLTGMEDD